MSVSSAASETPSGESGEIGSSQEAVVTITAQGATLELLRTYETELARLFIVSGVALQEGPPPAEQIVGHLANVLGQEMVSFEEPALWLLGRAAAGSMRDALSLTDQAIAFGSGKLGEDDVRSMLGTVDMSFVYQLLEALGEGEPTKVLDTVAHMAEHAPDFEGSLDELLSLIHRVAMAQVVPDAIDNSWGDAERIERIAKSMPAEDSQLFYQVAINGKRDMSFAADPRSGFEMSLLRMIAFRPDSILDESLTLLQEMELIYRLL